MRGRLTTALVAAVMVAAVPTVVDASVWWNYPGGWQICKDDDGWLVAKPDGGFDAWGNDYTHTQVERGYGLRSQDRRFGGRDDLPCGE